MSRNSIHGYLALLVASFIFISSVLYKFYIGFIQFEFLIRDFVIFILIYFICYKIFRLIEDLVEYYKDLF